MENRLKAIFIISLLLGNIIAMLHSGWLFFSTADFGWLPPLVTSGAICFVFLIHIGAGKRARTSRNLYGLLLITTASALTSLLVSKVDLKQIYAVGLSGIGSWLYVFWYSRLDRSASILQVGDQLPSLAFFDANNLLIETSDIDGPLLLVFYRGNWCPLCVAQVKEIAESYQALAKRGYSVLLISPQPQNETQKIAKQFSIPLVFCEDRHNFTAKKLGLNHQRALPYGMEKLGYSADAVHPTVIITDVNHKILWLDQTDNYRVRPEPADFLRVIDEYQSGDLA